MSVPFWDLKISVFHPFLMERILKYGGENRRIILKPFTLLDNI